MQRITTVSAMQAAAHNARVAGKTLALVPTMGALHEGHLRLVEKAKQYADHVTVSIFVNPTQFAPGEDFEVYPRMLDKDSALIDQVGAEVVFAPSVRELYPNREYVGETWVTVERLSDHLCGRYRDGHFRGVTTVVAKLFNACKPHKAFFGLKDAQQYFILKRMVADLCMDVDVVGVQTVREPDGLAMSSRNLYLQPEERRQAVVLSKAVEAARRAVQEGELGVEGLVEAMRYELGQAPLAQTQYAEVVDTAALQPLTTLTPGSTVLAAVAVYFGKTRLIDNAIIKVPASSSANRSRP